MKAADPKYCTGRIMAIKTGVNHSNNKKRCSAGNLDDLLWKYCKSRYTDLSCSDVHWNFWRMCNALRLGSEVYDWYRLLHRFGEEGAQVFKKSLQFLFCILHPACVLLSVCTLHFTLSLQFTPGPQYAVCSPQSASYTDRYWMFSRISEVGPNRKLVPSNPRLSFWTVWFRHNRRPGGHQPKRNRFIAKRVAKRKSRWPCDARVIHARFARDEIINLAARRFARNKPNLLIRRALPSTALNMATGEKSSLRSCPLHIIP